MTGLTRRRFGVLAISAPIWATPIVRSVSVAGASQAAQMGSRPPTHPQPRPESPPATHTVESGTTVAADLPYTGDNEMPVTAIGVAAVAAGAVLAVSNRERRIDPELAG